MSSVVVTCRGSTLSAGLPLADSLVSLMMDGIEFTLDMMCGFQTCFGKAGRLGQRHGEQEGLLYIQT